MKVMCILTDGFEELEAIGSIAILKRSGLEVDIYALDNVEATGRFDVTIKNLKKATLDACKEYDALLIPGGAHHVALRASQLVKEIIMNFKNNDKVICAICAGPTILGDMGLLEGKQYTCFTSMNKDFGGSYIDQYVVSDGNLITARSAAASIDFGFAIVEKLLGVATADKTKNEIYY